LSGLGPPRRGVEIKVDTFNFTRYGLLHGGVISLSQDSITRDKPQDKSTDTALGGATTTTSEPKGQELLYAARVSLDRTQMQVNWPFGHIPWHVFEVPLIDSRVASRLVFWFVLIPLPDQNDLTI
jgi:hypothetical protein